MFFEPLPLFYREFIIPLVVWYLMYSKLNDFEYEGEVYELMILSMKLKFKKYFQEMSLVITCAVALNPCLNGAGVKMLINDICNDLSLTDYDPYFSQNAIQHFNKCLQNMFYFYLLKYGSLSNVQDLMASGSTSSRLNPELNLYNSLRNAGSKL